MNDRDRILESLDKICSVTEPGPLPDAPLPYPGVSAIDMFIERANASAMNLMPLAGDTHLPRSIETYLKDESESLSLVHGHDPYLSHLPWEETDMEVRAGSANADDRISLSHAFRGVAESGSLVLLSGQENPSTNNFLVDHHLVVLERQSIVSHMESVWKDLRELEHWPPRAVHLISSPSATADIALELQVGVHGPRKLTVFLI